MTASLWDRIEPHLVFVKAPSQYIGDEWNIRKKDHSACRVKFLIAFPDAYSIGMSHLGLQILYGLLNDIKDVVCERAFAPWPDMEERMRRDGIPLFSVDSHRPAREFDFIGMSLQTEMGYSNVVNMLDLAGIPLPARDRGDRDPFIVAGGPCASYPEPVAEFFDFVVVGDGEDVTVQLVNMYRDMKGLPRDQVLREFAKLPGIYVPKFYEFEYDGPRVKSIRAAHGVPPIVCKALTGSLEETYYPMDPLVPYAEVVFDRINLEIMRGCPHRCRFCHAVTFKNKLRFRRVETLVRMAEELYRKTGHDEISLISLSSGDHPQIKELLTRLNARFGRKKVTIALPSLRIDEELKDLPPLMKTGRKTGFTIAPEGGTEIFRRVIRKPIRDADLFDTARSAFSEGFDHIKLYFMIGLPGETAEDLRGIVETARQCANIGKEVRGRRPDINVTISPFVPKPHTPFMFAGFQEFEYFDAVIRDLRAAARNTGVVLKIHNPRNSFIEAAFARGDRRLARVLLEAHKLGCKFDEWDEYYSFDRWLAAFQNAGMDPAAWARIEYTDRDLTPWDQISVGVTKEYLWREYRLSRELAEKRARGEVLADVPGGHD